SAHRSSRSRLPELRRLSEDLRDTARGRELGPCVLCLAPRHVGDETVEMCVSDRFEIADGRAELQGLPAERVAFVERVGTDNCHCPVVHRIRQGAEAARPAGKLDRLATQTIPSLSRVLVAKPPC